MATQTRSAVLALLVAGCGDRVYDIGAPIGAASESSSGAPQTAGAIDDPDSPSTTMPSSMSGESSDDDSPSHEEGPSFIENPDGGGESRECSLWDQDCPTGEKCNVYANDGGNSWNATRCFPIDPDPDAVGEPCTVVDNGVSGMDSCELGSMCWNVDAENVGTCVAFCQGSEANPVCADPNSHCEGRDVTLCLPSCCPLEQPCSEGEACYPVNDTFSCLPDAGGDMGAYGDGCEFINVCDPGFFCSNPENVPGCDGSIGCCTALCDVRSASCADYSPLLQCAPWFEQGQAPPGYENVGACVLEG